jgi:hypothetical protein
MVARVPKKPKRRTLPKPSATSLSFFNQLKWIDGRPLLDTIEPYRREIFSRALDTYDADGVPCHNLVLAGRAKKNWKTADLILAGLYCLVIRESPQGNDAWILANDEGQAADDLSLAKKIIAVNPDLKAEVQILVKEIRRRDGRGTMRILPAGNAVGQHGKTALFVGFDEVHSYRDWDLLEALQPDPSRPDAICWITSYDSIFDIDGCPLHDLKVMGKAGTDHRMLFSWYSADYCNDPDFADLPPEERANPSLTSWPEGKEYIEQQRRRLPSARFARLHLNLPGAPGGAFFDQSLVDAAIVPNRTALAPQSGVDYVAFVDMSGGSSDDAVLAIAHLDGPKAVLDLLISQVGGVPFNPRLAVERFAEALKRYSCRRVTGDSYAGLTFRQDFQQHQIDYHASEKTRSQLYEDFEVVLNAGAVELLDIAKMRQQMLTLVIRGAKVDHMPGAHDDFANAMAGAIVLLTTPTFADAWITHAKGLAERAQLAVTPPDEDDEQPAPFYLPGNPHIGEPRPAKKSERPALMPSGLAGNSFSESYFRALGNFQGSTPSPQAQKCSFCKNETLGTRLADGERVWCNTGCHQKWIAARVEKAQARAIAENSGLPLTSHPVKKPTSDEVLQ